MKILMAVSVVASCTTPRPTPTIAEPSITPTPSRSDSIDPPYRPSYVDGTVTTTFPPGRPTIVAGDSRIQPDEETRRAIGASGVVEVTGSFEVCSDTDGKPTKVTMTRSTAYDAYDRELGDGIQHWRFWPREVKGQYVASCIDVQLTYRPWRGGR